MSTSIVYCFDKALSDKLSKTSKLLKQEEIDNKSCWVFVVDNNSVNFSELEKSKIVISNKLNF